MRTFHSQSQASQRRASSSLRGISFSTASITFISALLILAIPLCNSGPVELPKTTTDQLIGQIDAVCSSYLSAELTFWASDALGELCVLMLVQKSKELKIRENSKRAEFQGPLGLQSRNYFHYRPRNGRRTLENE